MSLQKTDKITLWTSQRQIVLDCLEREGIYTVKKEYVRQKYGDTGLPFFEAYSFFSRKAPSCAVRPEGAESPIWAFPDRKWFNAADDEIILRCSVPAEFVIFFDMRIWNAILNLKYVPSSEKDGARFEEQLRMMGIRNTYSLFSTRFYPLQKAEVIKSWERLFASDDIPDEYRQAAVWCLKKDWIEEIIRLG